MLLPGLFTVPQLPASDGGNVTVSDGLPKPEYCVEVVEEVEGSDFGLFEGLLPTGDAKVTVSDASCK